MSDFHDTAADDRSGRDEPSGSWTSAEPAPPRRSSLDLHALARWLPRLGAVLWLDRSARRHAPMRAVTGSRGLLLLDHPALDALARSTIATAHTQVTPHGPREWLAFRDASGETLAKLFLLPDTDYLAWDEMTAAAALAPRIEEPARWHAHAAFLRQALARIGTAWQARLFTFEQRKLPWLQTLDARSPLRLSLLGLELARLIARSEGAELVSPLHAA